IATWSARARRWRRTRLSDARTAGRPDGLWNLIIDAQGRSGIANMTIDELLLAESVQSGSAFLRLYRWDPPTLSIGRNQPAVITGVPVVRRPTGGQAVWHDPEVTCAAAAPLELLEALRNSSRERQPRTGAD